MGKDKMDMVDQTLQDQGIDPKDVTEAEKEKIARKL